MTYDLQYRVFVMAFSMLLVCKCKCNVNLNTNLYSTSAQKTTPVMLSMTQVLFRKVSYLVTHCYCARFYCALQVK